MLLDTQRQRQRDIYDVIGRFRSPMIVLILVNTIGILGFMMIDHYPFLDAVYQTVFTLTTVGYQETHPISDAGKIFVIILILGGVIAWSYALGVTISVVVNDNLVGKLRDAIMEHQIRQYHNHFIIVGYTEITRQVLRKFLTQNISFVVIEDNSDRLAEAERDDISDILPLNPFLNESFRRAHVSEARGIISTFPDDADNITVVVTGKILEETLKRSLLIISVASRQESRAKLLKVGAEVVILPNELIGQRISAVALHPPSPDQNSFLDRVAFGEFLNLDIREVRIPKKSSLDGVAIRNSGIRDTSGAHIVGIRRRGRRHLALMPNPDTIINGGDQILIMGTLAQLQKLSENIRLNG